ncbi:unnamed protein product [Rotaria sp. Silwood2]|nr:unnamed protein product [Rotaria sp. Silwood2]CAF4518440.1 unnamed protein product [Rotaria sp. Silwood2]
MNISTKWKPYGSTSAGENKKGNQLNQLDYPRGIYVDDDNQSIYIADWGNHRIVEYKFNDKNGKVVAGGNGQGNRIDQLNKPTDVIVDKKNNSLLISDQGNRRVMEWFRQNDKNGQVIISNIDCWEDGKKGQTNGTIVAGGHEEGYQLNQFDFPTYIFVDQDYSIYVSDWNNHRVMKWMKDAKEGIVVAGGEDPGDSLTQLSGPQGVIVDSLSNIYVVDCHNHQIMRWLNGSKEGSIVVGGNGEGNQQNQLNGPRGLTFDREGNLYVVDHENHRVQKFDVISN